MMMRGEGSLRRRRVIYDVVFNASTAQWLVKIRHRIVYGGADTKAEALKWATDEAKRQPLAQVRIHTKEGQFQSERTYPRSSDPRRTPG